MDKRPEDRAQCPLCREEFTIPQNGLEGLKLNFYLQGLVDTKRASCAKERAEPCEVCSNEQKFVLATVFCVDCSQKLCERCSLPHRRWRGGAHDVIPLRSEPRSTFADVQKDFRELKIRGKLEFVSLMPMS